MADRTLNAREDYRRRELAQRLDLVDRLDVDTTREAGRATPAKTPTTT